MIRPAAPPGDLRPCGLLTVVAALVLGDLALILAALGALVAADAAMRRFLARVEREADEGAAELLGSVRPLLLRRQPPRRWDGLAIWLTGNPARRPWLAGWQRKSWSGPSCRIMPAQADARA